MFKLTDIDNVKIEFKGSYDKDFSQTFLKEDYGLKDEDEYREDYYLRHLEDWNKNGEWKVKYYVNDIPKKIETTFTGTLKGKPINGKLTLDLVKYFNALIPDIVSRNVEEDGTLTYLFNIQDDFTENICLTEVWSAPCILLNKPRTDYVRYSEDGYKPHPLISIDDLIYEYCSKENKEHDFGDFGKFDDDYSFEKMCRAIEKEELDNGWTAVELS